MTSATLRLTIGSETCPSRWFTEISPPTSKMEDDFSELSRPQMYLFGERFYSDRANSFSLAHIGCTALLSRTSSHSTVLAGGRQLTLVSLLTRANGTLLLASRAGQGRGGGGT